MNKFKHFTDTDVSHLVFWVRLRLSCANAPSIETVLPRLRTAYSKQVARELAAGDNTPGTRQICRMVA